MHRTARSVVFAAAIAGMMLVAASNAKGITRRPNLSESLGVALGVPLLTTFQKPALIAVDWSTSGLEYWPIKPGGGNNARKLSGPLGLGYASLVAHGNVVIAAKESPPEVLLYNVVTKQKRVLADPYGPPVDIAIGKDASLYVLDYVPGNNNVAWYPPGASKPKKLSCKGLGSGAIAVDSSGNVFVQGYGVVEIPRTRKTPNDCLSLQLRRESGYPAGLAIDPKTQSLITLMDTDYCAGGWEGMMTIYPKPYQRKTGKQTLLGGNCTGGLRLNADSTIIFHHDQTVSGGQSYIVANAFPSGAPVGAYYDQSSGGPGAFTTIPNTLPN